MKFQIQRYGSTMPFLCMCETTNFKTSKSDISSNKHLKVMTSISFWKIVGFWITYLVYKNNMMIKLRHSDIFHAINSNSLKLQDRSNIINLICIQENLYSPKIRYQQLFSLKCKFAVKFYCSSKMKDWLSASITFELFPNSLVSSEHLNWDWSNVIRKYRHDSNQYSFFFMMCLPIELPMLKF